MATAAKRKPAQKMEAAFIDGSPTPVRGNRKDFYEELLLCLDNKGKWLRLSGSGYPATKKATEIADSLDKRERNVPNSNDVWEFMVGVVPDTGNRRFVFARYLGTQEEVDAAENEAA